MKIEYLCDHIHFADTIAKWIFDEFIDGIKIDRTYEDTLASFKNCHKTEFPIRFIMMDGDKCAGTISIVENDLRCRKNYYPWLAGLYVDKSCRNQKIGEQLLNNAKNIVAGMGHKELYLRTEHASGYYRRLGWEFVESCDDDYNLVPDVFVWKF